MEIKLVDNSLTTGFFLNSDDKIITLNFWGGEQTYNKITKTYRMVRSSGIFSNLTVSIYAIFVLSISGYEVENIELEMTDYLVGYNIYPLIFEKKKINLFFDDIPIDEIVYFLKFNHPTNLGLNFSVNTSKTNFNFKITNKIIEKFFCFNSKVLEVYREMVSNKKLIDGNYIHIWARRTDKIFEISIPPVDLFLSETYKIKQDKDRMILQTDDEEFLQEFIKKDKNIEYFNCIPFAKPEIHQSFHQKISYIGRDQFLHHYGMSVEHYVIKMCCVVLFSVNSKKSIIYPGNPSTIIPLYRNSFDQCVLFINNNQII
jgi:hypothetical protein